MLKTKSVHSPKVPGDGLRILATRVRGRGLPTTAYDVWMPNLAPNETLLHDYRAGKVPWPEFSRRYKAQIAETSAVDRGNRVIKNHGQKFTLRLLQHLAQRENVTLMCHCAEAEQHCHRHLLKLLIDRV